MFVHMSQILYCPVAWIIKVRSICHLLQARPPERVVRISLFSFQLIHTKVMDSKGRSKCEGCAKWGSHLKFTYFEGASSFSLKYFQKCMNFCL